MVRCRPTGNEKNTRTTGHDNCLSLVVITFGFKPQASPLFGLCISVLMTFCNEQVKSSCLSFVVSVSLSMYDLCNNSCTVEWIFSIVILDIYKNSVDRFQFWLVCLPPVSRAQMPKYIFFFFSKWNLFLPEVERRPKRTTLRHFFPQMLMFSKKKTKKRERTCRNINIVRTCRRYWFMDGRLIRPLDDTTTKRLLSKEPVLCMSKS